MLHYHLTPNKILTYAKLSAIFDKHFLLFFCFCFAFNVFNHLICFFPQIIARHSIASFKGFSYFPYQLIVKYKCYWSRRITLLIVAHLKISISNRHSDSGCRKVRGCHLLNVFSRCRQNWLVFGETTREPTWPCGIINEVSAFGEGTSNFYLWQDRLFVAQFPWILVQSGMQSTGKWICNFRLFGSIFYV